jgi:hypothetical protein
MFSKKKNSYEWVVKTTVETLGIKKQEAQKRVTKWSSLHRLGKWIWIFQFYPTPVSTGVAF